MNRKARKTSSSGNGGGRVRVTLSIPRTMWPYFERQRKSVKHCGNRSSYIRSLILEQMKKSEKGAAAHEIKAKKMGAKH